MVWDGRNKHFPIAPLVIKQISQTDILKMSLKPIRPCHYTCCKQPLRDPISDF